MRPFYPIAWPSSALAGHFFRPRRGAHLAEGAPEPLAAVVESLGSPEIVCLQEIRVRPEDAPLIERMRSALPGYA